MPSALRLPVAAVFLLLAACAAPRTAPIPDITFVHLQPITLAVRTVDVTSAYVNNDQPPNVETKMQTPPSVALERWGRDRLRAVGSVNSARFTVLSAPMTEEPLPKKTGFVGAFQVEPAARYTLTVEAQVEIFDDGGQRLAVTSARTTQSGTLEEGSTPDQRQMFWYRLTKATLDAFNDQMERAILQYLRDWTT